MKKNLLAIEFDDYALKLMQAAAGPSGWKVSGLEVEEITGRTEEDLTGIIKDKMHKLKIKRPSTVLIIPRSAVTVRTLQLPASDPDELKKMVDIQVVRQIPYTREEMVYDYEILGTTEEGYAKVLLVIAHRDIISKYFKILEKAGISLSSIELASLAIVQLFKFVNTIQKNESKKFPPDVPVALIDIDYSTTNIVIIQDGEIPVFTRSVSIGTMHLDGKASGLDKKDWVSEWIGEINRSLNVYQREGAVNLENILVIGNPKGQYVSVMAEKLGININSWDINPLIEGISLQGDVAKINGAAVSISSLLGVIREGPETSVNLIPESIRMARITRQRRKSLVMTGLLLAGIIGVTGLTINKKIQDRHEYLTILERRLKETGPLAKELEIKKGRLDLIKNQLSVEGTSLDILKELYTIIPKKTSLSVCIYDDKLGVTLKGVSPAMSDVFGLIPKLEGSPLFASVTSRYATQRKIKGQELTDFHIDCSIEQGD